MTAWRNRLVLVLALAVMPLQGVTATLLVLLCHGDAQAHAMHAQDVHQGHEHGTHHYGGHPDEGGAKNQAAYHPCCHLTASAPPVATLRVVALGFPVGASAPDSLHDLFFPEQPQRPPLA